MNLCAWGFSDQSALERHLNPLPVMEQRKLKYKTIKWARASQIAAYAATLRGLPTRKDVQAHFKCSERSAYRYWHAIAGELEKRA